MIPAHHFDAFKLKILGHNNEERFPSLSCLLQWYIVSLSSEPSLKEKTVSLLRQTASYQERKTQTHQHFQMLLSSFGHIRRVGHIAAVSHNVAITTMLKGYFLQWDAIAVFGRYHDQTRFSNTEQHIERSLEE